MTKRTLRLATTHLDRHNERFTVGALESMVEQSNGKIIPLGYEHDPRIAPLGRIIKTELVELEDGEFAVDGSAELFDEDLSGLTDLGQREIPVREFEADKFTIIADRNFRDEEGRQDIEDLKGILNDAKTEEEIKKAFEPLSILTVGAAFALGAIASGFFGEMGAEAYRALKEKLKKIFSKRLVEGQERLFTFDTTISNSHKSINVEVIITNPTDDDIEQFFDKGLNQLDLVLPNHFANNKAFKRIVFDFKNGNLKLKFAVLKNGVPVIPK